MMLFVQDLKIGFDQELVLSLDKLQLDRGEVACILGPSGSGKSSFLRTISGLMKAKSGQIKIADTLVDSEGVFVKSEKRNVGMVFQDLCLFPHMSVEANIAYGLHELDAQQKTARIDELLTLVGLEGFAKRFPYELSGGQQQRVAIARAIAPKPSLLLMDEPFSSLDPSLRSQLAADLRILLKSLDITAVIVTHDQDEAFALADKIAVFADNKCQQYGSAYELYHEPASLEVARFIGEGTLVAGSLVIDGEQSSIRTSIGDLTLDRPDNLSIRNAQAEILKEDSPVLLLIRPDDIIHNDKSDKKAIVKDRQFRGSHIMFKLDYEGTILSCLAPSHHNHKIGESFGIKLDIQHLVFFPAV